MLLGIKGGFLITRISDSSYNTLCYIHDKTIEDSTSSPIGYFEGDAVLDTYKNTIGYVLFGRMEDTHHDPIGYIEGDTLYDAAHTPIAYIYSERIEDSLHNTVGYVHNKCDKALIGAVIVFKFISFE